jgi:hypothetical protein
MKTAAEAHALAIERTYRLYTELGMQVRTKRRKKLAKETGPSTDAHGSTGPAHWNSIRSSS